jgi:LPPG:FO 2-phospho-L-lactate transferase
MTSPDGIAVLAGGVGAARLLAGMVRAVPPQAITAIVNVGDDLELHGLHISPDIDTVIYTVAGAIDTTRGWGLDDETWRVMDALERYGGETWFRLGDRDLATHLYRTHRMSQGARLSAVTAEIGAAWGLALRVIPATDDRLRTMISLADGGVEVSFQTYFVRRAHADSIEAVRYDGDAAASPAPGVLDALSTARTIVIAPSNPIVSIGPVLAVPGIREAIQARRTDVVAVSPIVGGRALKGPADRMLRDLGHEASAEGVARLYATLAGTLVIDTTDGHLAGAVEAAGARCIVTNTVMADAAAAAQLSATVVNP